MKKLDLKIGLLILDGFNLNSLLVSFSYSSYFLSPSLEIGIIMTA